MMCSNEWGVLTLDGLLRDPLTMMVMRSDGVSERDFSDLLLRVQDCLLARHQSRMQPEEAALDWTA